MRSEGIHTEKGMPINTGLHTGTANNNKTRLNNYGNVNDSLGNNTAFN